jgi:RNA polymerase sigma-70 factor (ECF subfamily)
MENTEAKESAERDAALVRRFLAGDEEAFSSLVALYQDGIYQFALWHGGATREAEDLAQEIFIEAFKSMKNFRGESSFKTWLYGLARNVCLYRARKNGSGRMLQENEEFAEVPDTFNHCAEMEREEEMQSVREAVNGMPQIYREIILLREWENMSYEEIAQALAIPVGTVRSRLHNATLLLAKHLRAQEALA